MQVVLYNDHEMVVAVIPVFKQIIAVFLFDQFIYKRCMLMWQCSFVLVIGVCHCRLEIHNCSTSSCWSSRLHWWARNDPTFGRKLSMVTFSTCFVVSKSAFISLDKSAEQQTFINNLIFRIAWVSQHQKRKSVWILWCKRWWGGSGISWTICKSLETDYRLNALPDAQPTASNHWGVESIIKCFSRVWLSVWWLCMRVCICPALTPVSSENSH